MERKGSIGRRGAQPVGRLSDRAPRNMHPSLPEWDQARQLVPWWEAFTPSPCAPHRIDLEAATSGPGPGVSTDANTAFPLQSGSGTGERAWTPMKRVLLALSTLAAIFLVAGATGTWH